jgi:hypothetical protein
MRNLLALLMIVHGGAHLVGFASAWGALTVDGAPIKTTVLSDRINLGVNGARFAAVLWLAAALAFALAGGGGLLGAA